MQILDRYQGYILSYHVITQDDRLMKQLVAFERLAAFWMLRVATPQGLVLPLPEPVPAAFATLPEFFVEDMCEVRTLAVDVQL